MYKIYLDGDIIHYSKLKDDGLVVSSPKLTLQTNKAGSLQFTIAPTNPKYNAYKKLSSIVTVYNDDTEIFRGRVLDDTKDFYLRKTVVCEGDLNFLLDSVYRPFEFTGDIPDLVNDLITNHNSQVEEVKQFNIGNITITDSNNYINRSSVYYNDTLTVVTEKILDTHGGYIATRKGDDGNYYIDFLSDYENVSSQVIEFGKNLIDIEEYITAEDVYTVLIPLGAEVEIESDDDEIETERITIESVNNGLDYIYSESGIALFGKIWATEEWEDVTEPSNLLTKAKAELANNIELAVTITINAIDLRLMGVDVELLNLGDYVRIVSLPHGIDSYYQLSKITLYMDELDQSEYEFGVSYSTLSETTASKNRSIAQVSQTASEASSSASNANTAINNITTKLDEDYVTTSTFNSFKTTLGTASTTDTANYLTVQTSGYVLDARQGYVLNQKIENVSDDIPTKVSQLENDSGYLKEHQSLDDYVDLETYNLKIQELEDRLSTLENTDNTEENE